MIGSISKIRPCGHHHYYKYAHAKNTNDVKAIDDKYKQDSTDLADKVWDYPLLNLTSAANLFRDIKTGEIVTVNLNTPKVTNNFNYCFYTDFSHSNVNYVGKGIEEVNLNAPNATSLYTLIYMNTNLRKFEMVGDTGKKLTSLSYFAEGTYNLTDWTHHNFSNVTNLNSAFFGSRGALPDFKMECDFRKVIYADTTFRGQSYLAELKHAYKLDDNGNKVWIPQEYDEEGNAIHPWMYNEFPELIDASNMFYGCRLDKPSTLSILNSLKDWTNNTANHRIYMGMQSDLKYDPELNLELKKLDKDYTAKLEQTSVGLNEVVEKDKNWTLSVAWNGYVTKNEIINPDIIDEMGLNEIILPNDYKRCIRLIGDSKQFIKTGYIPTSNTGLWAIYSTFNNSAFIPVGSELTYAQYFQLPHTIGEAQINYSKSALIFKNTDGNSMYEKGSCAVSSLNWLGEKKATVYFNDFLKGEIDLSNISITFDSAPEIYLFGRRRPDGYYTTFNGVIYRVKISEGTEIVRDFIPCLDANGKPCMRDVINGVDYYNQGTGADFDYEIYESE